MNIFVMIGKLTSDVEVSSTKNGNTVCNLTIEDERKNGEKDIVSLQYYGKNAEQIVPYLTKGRKVLVQGRLKTESWNYNNKQYNKLVVQVGELEVLGFEKDDRGEPKNGPYANDGLKGPETFDDDDIPF